MADQHRLRVVDERLVLHLCVLHTCEHIAEPEGVILVVHHQEVVNDGLHCRGVGGSGLMHPARRSDTEVPIRIELGHEY